MWLDHFEFDVIWITFQLCWKIHFHISVLWCFHRIFMISDFSFFGYRAEIDNRKIKENFSNSFLFMSFYAFA